LATDVIENSAVAESNASLDTVAVLHQPALLARHPKAHDEDIGPGSTDCSDNRYVLTTTRDFVEISVVNIHNAQPRELLEQEVVKVENTVAALLEHLSLVAEFLLRSKCVESD
jgi:hypothetical protein